MEEFLSDFSLILWIILPGLLEAVILLSLPTKYVSTCLDNAHVR